MSSFDTTNWSLVLEVHGESQESQEAFEELCRAYWGPLFAFVRRSGYDDDTAKDLVQGFFLHLVARRSVTRADPNRGRFRNFLLSSLKNYVADQHDRQTAKKRSPGTPLVSLDAAETGELPHRHDPVDRKTPETVYATRWAAKMVDQAMRKLGDELAQRGRGEIFEKTRTYLMDNDGPSYRAVSEELGITENAVKSAVRSQRKRLGVLLRDEVAQVLEDAAAVDAELREILRNLEVARGAAD